MTALFEKASRLKLRFESDRGLLSVEELWDRPLRGKTSLDSIAQAVNKKVTEGSVKSFVDQDTSPAAEEDVLRLEILKHIISVRKNEEDEKIKAASRRQHNARIRELIAERQDDELKGKSIEELQAMLQ